MEICGHDYKLTFDKKLSGGEFYCNGKKSTGRGEIYVGDYKDLRGCVEILLHEVIESILCEEDKRFFCSGLEDNNSNRLFIFNHDYFDTLCPKILGSMLSSGMIKLVDNRNLYRKNTEDEMGKKGKKKGVAPAGGKGKKCK